MKAKSSLGDLRFANHLIEPLGRSFSPPARQAQGILPRSPARADAYTGNSVTTADPAGIWKKNVTDAFGNLTAVYEPDPATGSATTGPVTNYTYNGANQLTNVSMVRGTLTQIRTFTYSGSDLASETTPEAGTVTYAYDGNHHVTQRTDALGQQTQYSYDAYERLVEVRHYVGGTEQTRQRVDYVYDTPRGRRLHAELHLGAIERRAISGSDAVRLRPGFCLRVQL